MRVCWPIAAAAVTATLWTQSAPVWATPTAKTTVQSARRNCRPAPEGHVRCFAEAIKAAGSKLGYSPAQIKSAYKFPTGMTAGSGRTVAIVTAFDAPTIEHDLGVFSTKYSLPKCTTANGCFTKLDSAGGTAYPVADSGWAFETSIDVEWVHAIAPGAKIVLVEATDNAFANMIVALDTAKTKGTYVSNSWGSPQASPESALDHHFTEAPAVSFFFSAGDTGAQATYPAASPDVIAVGGTTLKIGRTISETGWANGGGGCSPYETASAAQAAFATYPQVNCAGQRAVPDISMVADPATGVAVYDTTPDENNLIGWFKAGGTSVGAPIMTARAADAGVLVNQAYIYHRAKTLFRDVHVGNNGNPALVGFDLVTGRGSWLH